MWSTHDGGATWQQQAPPDLYRDGPIFDLEAGNGTGRGCFNAVLAAPTASTIVTTRGTNAQQLVASFDGGRHWDVVYRADFFCVGFTSPTQGIALAQRSTSTAGRTSMVMTFDGGHHWSVVHL